MAILIRWAVAFVLLALTWNPTRWNYLRWAEQNGHKVEVLIVKNAAHGDVLNDAEGRRTYADWLKSLTSTQAAALPTS